MGEKAEENKKQKRNALINHAFALFMSKGVENTSISDITQSAGVGKGTFYYYFKDKNDIVSYLIADKAEKLLLHALDALENHDGAVSVEDKFIIVADDILMQLRSDKRLLLFINKNLSFGLYRKSFSGRSASKELDAAAIFREMIEDGSKWKEPDLMLYTVVEFVSGTCHTVLLNDSPVSLGRYQPYLHDCIRGIINSFRIQ